MLIRFALCVDMGVCLFSAHVTACSTNNRMSCDCHSAPFPSVFLLFFFTVAVRVFVSVCVCGLRVPLTYM